MLIYYQDGIFTIKELYKQESEVWLMKKCTNCNDMALYEDSVDYCPVCNRSLVPHVRNRNNRPTWADNDFFMPRPDSNPTQRIYGPPNPIGPNNKRPHQDIVEIYGPPRIKNSNKNGPISHITQAVIYGPPEIIEQRRREQRRINSQNNDNTDKKDE